MTGLPREWSLMALGMARARSGDGAAAWSRVGVKPRSRRLLPTTKSELAAIAAPAIIGSSSPSAARGSAATL